MNGHPHPHPPASRGDQACCSNQGPRAPTSAVDPVCGMQVDPARIGHHAEHMGTTYHFCSARCRERFIAGPENYLGSAATAQDQAIGDHVCCATDANTG